MSTKNNAQAVAPATQPVRLLILLVLPGHAQQHQGHQHQLAFRAPLWFRLGVIVLLVALVWRALHDGRDVVAGVAVGLDRVLMLRLGEDDLDAVLSFSLQRC